MKKQLIFAVAAVFAFFYCTAVFADNTGKFAIGVETAYYNIAEQAFPGVSGLDIDCDATSLSGGVLTYYAADFFSAEFSVDYAKATMKAEGNGVTLGMGELVQIPLMLTARFHVPNESICSPYMGGGVGYYINDFDTDGTWADVLFAGRDYKMESDNCLGYHANAGVEINAGDSTVIDIDLKYIWCQTDFEESIAGRSTGTSELDLNGFVMGVGVKWLF